jgi:hypothetical protein
MAIEKQPGTDYFANYPSDWTKISLIGETAITTGFEKLNVRVIVRTHEEKISVPVGKELYQLKTNRSSCTYGCNPCSVVDYIDIFVNDRKIKVPRSVFCTLADLNRGKIWIEDKKNILVLSAADGADSYFVKIEFNNTRVTRTRRYDSPDMDAASLFEDISYREIVYK